MCPAFTRQSDREFLRGYRPEPYTVRRTEMMVGGRRGRRRLDLSYMEGLMTTNTPPSLSSLPTPAQLCSKHTSIRSVHSDTQTSKRNMNMCTIKKYEFLPFCVNIKFQCRSEVRSEKDNIKERYYTWYS